MELRVVLASTVVLLLVTPLSAEEKPSADAASAPIVATIDFAQPGQAINPFIYGQFIEHLGRCIYGGIWAEMLEDRKFYFPVTDQYEPYRDLKDTPYPVVGASPWQVVGPAGSVEMSDTDPFVGEHTPLVAPDSGIRQNDLGLVADREYTGYVWLRAPSDPATVSVSLVWGEEPVDRQGKKLIVGNGQYYRFPFSFKPDRSTDHGQLEIAVEGAACLVGTVSLMPADNVRGMRRDTLALLKELGAPMYRWPGGNFVSGYDWRDGIGPRDRRPPRKNPAWTGVEHNDMGIDEFIDFCREVGAEPMIAANTGFGDAYSAAQEVEYCNAAADTVGGSWRAANGHPEPYSVKYWCVGNEMWGPWQLGFMKLQHYTQKHNLVADAMRKVDPNLVLVGSGDLNARDRAEDPGEKRSWSEGLIQDSGDHMDLISEHFYSGRLPWEKEREIPTVEQVGMLREQIRMRAEGHRALQQKLGRTPERFIPIAMDEWNFWHRDYDYGELGCRYDLTDALGVAAGLHEYFRQSDLIHMAHYAQTVNVIGCIKTTKTDAFFDATALPLALYRREFGTVPLAVGGDWLAASLDVAAARTEDGAALTVGIVNPHAEERTIALSIEHLEGAKLAATATLWRIAGSDPKARNAPGESRVAIEEQAGVPFGQSISVPPYSVSLYRVAID